MLASLPLNRVHWIVSSIPGHEANMTLMHVLRSHGHEGRVALTIHTIPEADLLKQAGADVVLLPFWDAAVRAVELLASSNHEESGSMEHK